MSDGVVDGLGHVADVLLVHPAHVDAPVSEQEHLVLLDHVVHLCLRQSSVGEHAYLRGHMSPIARRAHRLEFGAQQLTHLAYARRHGGNRVEPLLAELWSGEDPVHDASSVRGRVGPVGTDDQRDLRAEGRQGGWIVHDDGEVADALIVET